MFVNPRIADEQIPLLYGSDYYNGRGFDASINYFAQDYAQTGENPGRFMEIVESIEESAGGLKGAACLDIGCGTGELVRLLNNRGANAVGMDSSSVARDICRQRNIPVLDCTIDDLTEHEQSFDVVSAVEVIEHVTSPKAFLLTLRRLLKPGGTLYVGTGNWSLVRLERGTPYIMPEGHIYYFTPSTLRAYFSVTGIGETHTFNRSWILWRLLKASSSPAAVQNAVRACARTVEHIAPAYGPFPIGTL